MINQNTAKQGNVWEVGSEVKVGFLKLRVLGARAVKDYMPDIYDLESLDGSKRYEFIPHNGLHKVEKPEEIKDIPAAFINYLR